MITKSASNTSSRWMGERIAKAASTGRAEEKGEIKAGRNDHKGREERVEQKERAK